MNISHSGLFNDFLSFYFETNVNEKIGFITIIDYRSGSWTFHQINDEQKLRLSPSTGISEVLLEGKLGKYINLEEEKVATENIKPVIEAYILNTKLTYDK